MIFNDEFIFVRAIENDDFKALIDDLKEEEIGHIIIEPEIIFVKATSRKLVFNRLFIMSDPNLGRYYEEIEEILERHKDTVINYAKCIVEKKYFIAYAKAEYDEKGICLIEYSKEDIIETYDTIDEAWKMFDVVCKVYKEKRTIEFFEECYYYDDYGKQYMLYRDPIEGCCYMSDEEYENLSADFK
ncbi:MAG: hypothetical protein IJ395_06590 [Clostridia bacterium]|nr:hypothetical protein [Clostridia bacterium]